MNHVQNVLAFIRPTADLSERVQRAGCQIMINALRQAGAEVRDVWYVNDRAAWIRALRLKDIALVARLDVLAEPRAPGRSPSVDFAKTLALITSRGWLLAEAWSASDSSGPKWTERVEWAAKRIVTGRQLSPRKAAKMAEKRWTAATPGVVERWREMRGTPEFEAAAKHWRDPAYESAEAAFADFPEEIKAELGSVTTARRIFGRRRPGDAKAGGRPREKKQKR